MTSPVAVANLGNEIHPKEPSAKTTWSRSKTAVLSRAAASTPVLEYYSSNKLLE